MAAPAAPERKLRRLAISALAALAGWAAVLLPRVAWPLFKQGAAVADAEFFACVALAFVLAAWIVVVAPLVWFVPVHSRLWRWPVAASLGAAVGTVILGAFLLPPILRLHYPLQETLASISLGTLVGAITGGFGAWMLRRWTGGEKP